MAEDTIAAANTASQRSLPNILITGTPGTGKTSLCQHLVEQMPTLKHIDVNQIAKEEGLYDGFDEVRGVHVLNDDKVCDSLEDKLKPPGGCLVDTHSLIDYFPERWFDLVVVLETDNTLLYDRLSKRGYAPSKIQENVQAEIMKVIQEEARTSYDEDIVQVLRSDTASDAESNAERIIQWANAWIQENSA